MSAYTPTGNPQENTRGISQQIRAEFELIRAAINSSVITGTEAQGATENDYVVTASPTVTAYTTHSLVIFTATHANTSACTLKIGALSAKTLKDAEGNPLAAGDITSGAIIMAYYNGTDFFVLSGNDAVARSGDTYTGTHNMTGATVTVPTRSQNDNSTNAANTSYVDTGLASKANIASPTISSPTLTGVPVAPTAAAGTGGNQIATLDFVVATSFSTNLPGQTGKEGSILRTDGVNALWGLDVMNEFNRTTGVI